MLDNRRNDPAPFGSLLAAVEQAYLRSLPSAWNRRPRAAVASPEGIIVVASDPCEAISMQALVHGMREFFGDDWSAGDVALTNDVYSGASHATEFTALTPLFRRDGGLEGWLGIRALFPDVGGWDLGSYSLRALDIWSEGIRIVPVKLARQGVARREIIQILRLNSRTPHLTEACARSFLAAAAEASPDRLSTEGSISVENSVSVMVSNIRSRAVAFLRELPTGRTLVEARAPVPGEGPIAIKVAVEVGQSGLKISFPAHPPPASCPSIRPVGLHRTRYCALSLRISIWMMPPYWDWQVHWTFRYPTTACSLSTTCFRWGTAGALFVTQSKLPSAQHFGSLSRWTRRLTVYPGTVHLFLLWTQVLAHLMRKRKVFC